MRSRGRRQGGRGGEEANSEERRNGSTYYETLNASASSFSSDSRIFSTNQFPTTVSNLKCKRSSPVRGAWPFLLRCFELRNSIALSVPPVRRGKGYGPRSGFAAARKQDRRAVTSHVVASAQVEVAAGR